MKQLLPRLLLNLKTDFILMPSQRISEEGGCEGWQEGFSLSLSHWQMATKIGGETS
jgi:hypothetical protein